MMNAANHKISHRSPAARATSSLAALLRAAAPPESCGPDMPIAPARGPVIAAPQVVLIPKGASGWTESDAGYAGRAPMRCVDIWDRMAADAVRAKRAAPFAPGQVAMARRYRDLVERHDAGAVTCTRLDADGGAGTGGGGFADAWLAMARELDAIRRRIGTGASLSQRRVRPSRRDARRDIPDRVLVDGVCLGGISLDALLRRHGWAVDGPVRDRARAALSGALDRMIGYRGFSRGIDS